MTCRRLSLWFSLALSVAGTPACSDDDAMLDSDDGSTSGSTGAATDSATTGDTDGGDKPALGDSSQPRCEAAVFAFEQFEAEVALPQPDPDYLTETYAGTQDTPSALQGLIRDAAVVTGRVDAGLLVDDAAILTAIASGDRLQLIDATERMRAVVYFYVRVRLLEVSKAIPDASRDPALLYDKWDESYCLWDGMLRSLAHDADALPSAPAYERWEQEIDQAFVDGHTGIEGPDASWAIDEFVVQPAKELAEKSNYAVADRLVLAYAEQARANGDADAAFRARGLLRFLEDRLLGANPPGLDTIATMLEGDPSMIDPAAISTELDTAFVKLARKYCDEAVLFNQSGTATGLKGADEGYVYTSVILPTMSAALGLDPQAELAQWDALREAIAADDPLAVQEVSDQLVATNCAYQDVLGIPECVAGNDEVPGT